MTNVDIDNNDDYIRGAWEPNYNGDDGFTNRFFASVGIRVTPKYKQNELSEEEAEKLK